MKLVTGLDKKRIIFLKQPHTGKPSKKSIGGGYCIFDDEAKELQWMICMLYNLRD